MTIDIFIEEFKTKTLPKDFFLKFLVELSHFFIKLAFCILVYFLVLKLFKKILPLFRRYKSDLLDDSLTRFISSAAIIGVHLFLITFVLLILGVKESSLLAFFGTLGLGIGLALKDNLSNFAGGVVILFFNIYRVGDEVTIDDSSGFVHDIDIFSTTIRAHNNDLIHIPNGKIASDKIINYTKTPLRRLDVTASISYNDDIEKARCVLEELIKSHPLVLSEPCVYSYVHEYADSSINIALRGWCRNEDYWTAYKDVMTNIKPVLDKNNISIPYPQMDLHMNITKEHP